ncbi:hypothetical protein SAMN02745165_00024 [Malonomonas rubra DSM 5091]|uniref:Uncharacterized protein n=1 Tax=Malonomonas rubra DSM 5091 TaxID=1122189 RepID=A0A1M6B3N8_MALRU|nr:hypothetical protein [Malonomonas rubra]SHI43228.1 hypothetical protein SAMN02745165_00024 [Malonomonas rubra DSM 5091]
MSAKNLKINIIFTIVNVTIFFVLAKLLLFFAGLGLTVDQQTNAVTTTMFLIGGIICSIYVIYKNSPKQ